MLGIHDFHLNLRDQLVHFVEENRNLLKDFWMKQRLDLDQLCGVSTDSNELDRVK